MTSDRKRNVQNFSVKFFVGQYFGRSKFSLVKIFVGQNFHWSNFFVGQNFCRSKFSSFKINCEYQKANTRFFTKIAIFVLWRL